MIAKYFLFLCLWLTCSAWGNIAHLSSAYTYTLNANGQRLTMAEHSGRQSAYVYDKLGRVLSETITDALNGNHSAAYTYNKAGNRTAQTVNGVTTGYTYNANDWLLTAGSTAYTYDANGNTLTQTDGADVTTYVYDKRNKLIKATTPTDTVTYQYAPNGLRTQKATGGVTIDYLLDSQSGYGDVIAEYANGTKAKTYTIGDDLISQTQGQATFYYGYDGLGSTRMLFADTGAVTDSYDYTAFGEIHGETGTTDNTFLFTGEQYDSNVGQYYLRARYYNQAIGRFTQMDTYQGQMSDPESLHKYLYTANDPVNMVDPSGRFGLASVSISMNIRVSLSLEQMNFGYDFGNALINPNDYSSTGVGLAVIAAATPTAARFFLKKAKYYKNLYKFFSKQERQIILDVIAMKKLRFDKKAEQAIRNKQIIEMYYKDIRITVDHNIPASGITGVSWGINSFFIGRDVLIHGTGEITKTLLHEMYRVRFSKSIGVAVDGATAAAETRAAANFADKAFEKIFNLN